MIDLTSEEFKKIFYDYTTTKKFSYSGDKPAIIDFHAEWCGPCKMVGPILEKLEESGDFILYKIDSDEEFELAQLFNIRSIPTMYFVPVNGQPQHHIGAMSQGQIEKLINKYFKGGE